MSLVWKIALPEISNISSTGWGGLRWGPEGGGEVLPGWLGHKSFGKHCAGYMFAEIQHGSCMAESDCGQMFRTMAMIAVSAMPYRSRLSGEEGGGM